MSGGSGGFGGGFSYVEAKSENFQDSAGSSSSSRKVSTTVNADGSRFIYLKLTEIR